MTDLVEYKRPLIVLLIFASIVFLISNFGGHIFSYENFVDKPFMCNTTVKDRMGCIKAGGFWKEDGKQPANCESNCACCIPNASFPLSMNYPIGTCPETNDAYTLSDVIAPYAAGQSVAAASSLQRDGNNLLTPVALQQHIDQLTSQNIIRAVPLVNATSQEIHDYLNADESVLGQMQAEFCYYSSRYRYCVMKIIETAGSSASASSASASVMNDWITSARTVNTRMLDILTVMKYITSSRLALGPQMGADVAKLNADLTVRMNKLSEQNNDLVSGNTDNIVYKKMVQYTKQKAKANGHLVMLYTFMNLVALGMLFYVYRAT